MILFMNNICPFVPTLAFQLLRPCASFTQEEQRNTEDTLKTVAESASELAARKLFNICNVERQMNRILNPPYQRSGLQIPNRLVTFS